MAIEVKLPYRVKRGLLADWQSINPVLTLGEMGIVTDGVYIVVGDGVTAFGSLPDTQKYYSIQKLNDDYFTGIGLAIVSLQSGLSDEISTRTAITDGLGLGLDVLNTAFNIEVIARQNADAVHDNDIAARVLIADIKDDLVTANGGAPLSANQGVVLKALIDAQDAAIAAKIPIASIVDNLVTANAALPLSANQGVALKALVDALTPLVYPPLAVSAAVIPHTGSTANVIQFSKEITPNTIGVKDYLHSYVLGRRESGSGTYAISIYINTINSLTGATLIGYNATGATQTLVLRNTIKWANSTSLAHSTPSTGMASVFGATPYVITHPATGTLWYIVAVQSSVGTDTSNIYSITLDLHKN